MGQNFISCDRGQVFLLPPSLTDWLAEDHLVWTVLGAVDQMDLDGFYGAYRANGQGRAAYDPRMMVAVALRVLRGGSVLAAGRAGVRGDVAFRVITAMEVPDHSTIAEFRRRHQDAVGEPVRRGPGVVRGGGAGRSRGDRCRWDEDACERVL